MRRAGFNPTRRNRNIGTERQGHGQDNRMVIPDRWFAGPFWEQLGPHVEIKTTVHDRPMRVVVEHTSRGRIHAATPEDILRVLSLLPAASMEGLGIVVLRQPTRKQALLSCVWGRMAYYFDYRDYSGPALILEAFRPGGRSRWPRSMNVETQKEFERLRSDGFRIIETKREFSLVLDCDSVRNTQLYRTVPHEVGHWQHYLLRVKQKENDPEGDPDTNYFDAYMKLPERTHEDFADGFADRVGAQLRTEKKIPFARMMGQIERGEHGLRSDDFAAPARE